MECTQIREQKEGKKISEEVFVKKALGAIETTRSCIEYADRVGVDFIDLECDESIEKISLAEFDQRNRPLQKICLANKA